ncbi:methionyl-tRNA formyltransferase [Flavobacterium sp. CYK-4]|uniref:methionyl-tRNA formyltransferase n=1 Tax=Flavobacterium lotistagni TaxID=2709660 RepID=UPI00140CE74B|nr:methionyl-tRNA formyltransferase [Flavobacterium lotistagni]NHM06426.1 methionyl-tRNA formyltransferase [Flavobacterium lotistagni]
MKNNITENPKVILIGSVNSSRRTLEKLIEHQLDVVAVLGLHPEAAKNVSGYVDLRNLAESNDIPFQYFTKVNEPEIVEFVQSKNPDLVFVVGLSQMIREELLSIPKHGLIGYHPTRLPQGRGRGAIAWIILGKVQGAASFFKMDEGMDSGSIWSQVNYDVDEDDDATSVVNQILKAIDKALDKVLPDLKNGIFNTTPQDESQATYLGKRNPEDGLIDWNQPATEIHRLIRATTKPLPGAYSYLGTQKLIIWKASVSEIKNHLGVVGRIVIADENGVHIQTGEGLLKIENTEEIATEDLKVGQTLGINFEKEYFKLADRITKIENQLNHGK